MEPRVGHSLLTRHDRCARVHGMLTRSEHAGTSVEQGLFGQRIGPARLISSPFGCLRVRAEQAKAQL